ncbi:UNVERIFIED_CONTAM: Chloride channel protein CLC-c [Sesamum calycinum]|uniref:Chloride channel protein CLC-c n=1 Tax=Sesamum calycinum TaxID=2727403 RepID=A0AAW2JZ84_9LAMI
MELLSIWALHSVILAGSSYGRLVGPISNLDVGLFALLGAASFLGGTMRMRVSLCVILLELTNDLLMLPLVMLVLLISKTVADSFNKGKKFTKNRVLSGSKLLRFFHAFDFAKPGSGKGLKVEDLDLSVEEMEMYVDLYPITNTLAIHGGGDHVLPKLLSFFENLASDTCMSSKNTRAASDCWNLDKTRLYAGTYNGTLSRVHPPQGASLIRLAGSQISRDITSFQMIKMF